MHVPPVDRPIDDAEWRAFVRDAGFGQLIASGRARDVPVIVPTQYAMQDHDVVVAHVVAQNPILDALREQPRAVLSVAGDWAFVPSSWKVLGDEDPLLGLPTTYYAAVQLAGSCSIVEDPDELAVLLRHQLGSFQPDVAIADPAVAQRARLARIRGLRLEVEAVTAKFKYGGNVDEPHRRAVRARLLARDGPGDQAAAAHVALRVTGPTATGSAFQRDTATDADAS